nr:hypothetical protein [Vibrio splendidus]
MELLEAYQGVLEPKYFSVKNENTQRFMSGDYDNSQCIKWAYIPVTKPLLASLLSKELSFHDAFHRSDKLYLATIYTNEVGRSPKVELLNTTNKHLVNLPPVDFEIDLEEACMLLVCIRHTGSETYF